MWPWKKEKTKVFGPEDLRKELEGESGGAAVSVNPKQASQLSAVFSCVNVISQSIGMLPISLYEKKEQGREKVLDELYYLLAVEPNEWQTAQEFWEMVGAKLGFEGNFYAYINWVGGKPYELLPIVGSCKKRQGKSFEVWYEVSINGSIEHVPQENILHIPMLTLDGVTGVNPITHNRLTIGTAMESEKLGQRYVKNASRPGGVLSTDVPLKKDQLEEYQKLWEEKHGNGNNFRTALLGGGFKYYPTTMNAADMQYLEGKKFSRSEIAGIYRVPPHMIGDLDNAHHSNMEQGGQEFVTHCLMPYLTRIENRIRKQLIDKQKRLTQYAKFNVGALVRGDMAARGQFYTQLVQNGALSPNEIRELEDRPPREGGDIYLTPMNMLINGENLTKPS